MAKSSSKLIDKNKASRPVQLSAEVVVDSDSELDEPQVHQNISVKSSRSRKDGDSKLKRSAEGASSLKKGAKSSQPSKMEKKSKAASKTVADASERKDQGMQKSSARPAKSQEPQLSLDQMSVDSVESETESASSSEHRKAASANKLSSTKQVNGVEAPDPGKVPDIHLGSSSSSSDGDASADSDIMDTQDLSSGEKASLPKKSLPVQTKVRHTSADVDESSEEGVSENDESSPSNQRDQSPHLEAEDTEQTIAAYRPPRGFRRIQNPGTSSDLNLVRVAVKESKQVWHITTPGNLPTEAIESALLRTIEASGKEKRVLDGERIVGSHNGIDYRLVEDSLEKASHKIYLPQAGKPRFEPIESAITRVIHIRQKFTPPSFLVGNDTGADVQSVAAAAKPRAQQPPDLKIRYQPYGVTGVDAPLATRVGQLASRLGTETETPNRRDAKSVSPSKKRKVAVTGGDITTPKDRTERKKRRKERSEKDDSNNIDSYEVTNGQVQLLVAAESQTPTDGLTDKQRRKAEKKAKKAQTRATVEEVNEAGELHTAEQTSPGPGPEVGETQETPEERALRKAEKKRRKEEKRSRRAAVE